MPSEDDKSKDSKESAAKNLADDPAFQELQKQMKGLGIMVSQQQQVNAKLQENFNSLIQKLDQGMSGNDDPEGGEDAINDLDNSDLVRLVLKEVGKVIDEKIGGVSDKIQDTDNKLTQAEIKRQVIELGAKDFFEWGDEISDLAKTNPNLQVKQLYSLARDSNPDKAKQLDEKYKEKSDEDPKKKFLGLMPTSGATVTADNEKLTKEEAQERAWAETIEEFPGLANLGEG